jgi:hypothetical protein
VFKVEEEELEKREKAGDHMIMLDKERVRDRDCLETFERLIWRGKDDCQGGWSSLLSDFSDPIRPHISGGPG